MLGGGGFEDQKYPVVSLDTQHDKDIINAFNLNYKNYDPFNHEKRLSDPLPTATTDGNTLHELDYQCNSIVLEHLDILSKQDMLLGIITKNCAEHSDEKEIFYFHGDHLGSASWITDASSKPIQYIHYAPYGELIDNQRVINYDERYKFTGKERDAESGYDYFGARYYASPFSFWLSVDPLADKYPAISPYAYCTWNPIKFIDPDGKVVIVSATEDQQRMLSDLINIFEKKKVSQYIEFQNNRLQINNFNYFVKNLSFSQKKLFNDLYNITNIADEWYINYSETVDINGEIKSIDCIK